MTNEKDREEKAKIICQNIVENRVGLGWSYEQLSTYLLRDIDLFYSEAVQAERDRCTNAIENCRAKLGSFKNGAYTDVWNTAIEEAKKSILSTDQGTAEKESNRG